MDNPCEKRFRYCVLYIPGAEQYKLKKIIEEHMPKENGEAFIPCMELYRRGKKKVEKVPIFTGYVFLYTSLNIKEVHEMLMGCRAGLKHTFRELALQVWWMDAPDFLCDERGDCGIYGLSDLNGEESEFLDMLRQGNGLLSMSCGYEENKKYHVMEGPLKAYEDKIQKVDKHNRKAFLRFEIHGRQARAGFECKPKAYWFPGEETKIVTISDGTEVDLEELKRRLTTKS